MCCRVACAGAATAVHGASPHVGLIVTLTVTLASRPQKGGLFVCLFLCLFNTRLILSCCLQRRSCAFREGGWAEKEADCGSSMHTVDDV